MSDPRFNSANFDPIFSKKGKSNSKIKVDDRFKGVLTDNRYYLLSTIIAINYYYQSQSLL